MSGGGCLGRRRQILFSTQNTVLYNIVGCLLREACETLEQRFGPHESLVWVMSWQDNWGSYDLSGNATAIPIKLATEIERT